MAVTYSADDVRRLAKFGDDGPSDAEIENDIIPEAQGQIYGTHGSFFEVWHTVTPNEAEDDAFPLMPTPLIEAQLVWIDTADNTQVITTNFTLDLTTGFIDFSAGSSPVDLDPGDTVYVRYFPKLLKDCVNYRAAIDALDTFYHDDVDANGGPSTVRMSLVQRLEQAENRLASVFQGDPIQTQVPRLWSRVPG